MPKAEQVLWHFLKGRQLMGYKFRRQHGIEEYIVDFYCPELKLVIELDGDSHFDDDQIQKDAMRDKRLNHLGINVIRFLNTEVLGGMEIVLDQIKEQIETGQNPS